MSTAKTASPAFLSKKATDSNTVYGRQIAFTAAFLLPATKLLEAPSILAKYAAGDLLLPALLHFLLQGLLLGGVLFAVSRSEIPLFERMKNAIGKWSYVFYALFAAYYLMSAVLPILDFEKFVYAVFFDTESSVFAFAFFFLLSAFICMKGLKSVGRSADLCVFLFLLPFLALLLMSLWEVDFTRLLPLFGTEFSDSFDAFKLTIPHFSDVVLLLPLLGNYKYKKGDSPKIIIGYSFGAFFTLFFLAVFFGTYSSIAPRVHYAFSKIAQYFPALNVMGRVDLIFVYLLSIVLLFVTCLPLLYTTEYLATLFKTEKKLLFSLALNATMFAFTLFFNKYYNSIYGFFNAYLPLAFILIADMVPLFFLFLPKKRKITKGEAYEKRTR